MQDSNNPDPDMKRKSPSSPSDDEWSAPLPSRSRRRPEPYLAKLDALQNDLADDDINQDGQKRCYDKFSEKHLMQPSHWDVRLLCEPEINYGTYKRFTKRALSDFYSKLFFYENPLDPDMKDRFEQEEKPFDRLMEWQYWTKMTDDCIAKAGIEDVEPMLKEAMTFPHSQLQEVCWYYEEFAGTAMTTEMREQLKANKELYKEIKRIERTEGTEGTERTEESEGNTTLDWFRAVIATDDLRYIVQNVEARIAREIDAQLTAKALKPDLWGMYLRYLITKDYLLAEEVYYRFRRLFIDNRTFATYFPNFRGKLSSNAKEAMEKMKYNSPHIFRPLPSAPFTIYSNPTWIRQSFPFKNSLMHYIYKNASNSLTAKLYSSCKHLYFMKRQLLCHSLYIGKDFKLQYFRNSMASNGECPEFMDMDKFNVMNTLIVQNDINANLMHQIFPKLSACSLRFLRISNQKFFVNEYSFLTSGGSIMKLVFSKISIVDENDQPIILEDFLYQLPKAMYIDAPIKTRTTPETEELLFTWEKPVKIHCISLLLDDELMQILRPMKLFKFLQRLVVSIAKSTNVVQFEKGNVHISSYLQDLIQSTQMWKNRHAGKPPPKVLTLKDYENLL